MYVCSHVYFIYERAMAEIIPDKLIQVIVKCIPQIHIYINVKGKTYMDRIGQNIYLVELDREREFPYYLDLFLWHITIYINNTKQLNVLK